nr:alpha/beta hydrolase-fold protein [Streptomyces hawaiiensis]
MERGHGAGSRRAAAGESQGGFRAPSYAARHPGLFNAVACYSGFVHPLHHPHAVRAGMTYLGLDWPALWGDRVFCSSFTVGVEAGNPVSTPSPCVSRRSDVPPMGEPPSTSRALPRRTHAIEGAGVAR